MPTRREWVAHKRRLVDYHVDTLNRDVSSLRTDVEALATSAGRMVGTPGHEEAKAYLLKRLHGLGLDPFQGESFALQYDVGRQVFTNLVGVAAGRDPELAPLVVGAHYDTAGSLPGADDNAAAVAIALAVAERLLEEPAERSVLVALFDAEEPPWFHTAAMGSTTFYRDQRIAPIHAALVMDLVGHEVPLPNLGDLLFVTGMESDPGLESVMQRAHDRTDLRLVTALNRYVGDMSDHHIFRVSEVPYLFFSCGRWEHYHRPSDTPEKLDYSKMARIVGLVDLIAREVSARELSGPFEAYDTTATDLFFMEEALGSLLQGLGLPLESRDDIERVAMELMETFRI